MKYAYEDLSWEQFERLVVCLCQNLLGIAVQGFEPGPDGGRDARFSGTAELHPSKAAPWSGVVIIQAKHTNGHNKHFSEADFFSASSNKTILGREIPRVKALRKSKKLDHYMLFANRRLTANAEDEIRTFISKRCGIPKLSIYLCGVSQLDLLLKRFPDVPQLADLDAMDSPLIVSPDDLAEVVQAVYSHLQVIKTTQLVDPPIFRVSYSEKNKLNNMSAEYATEAVRLYLKEAKSIYSFLAAPENSELLRLYKVVVEEFQLKIIANRKPNQSFDKTMEYILDQLFDRDPILRQSKHKRLTRAILFYMYWNCDIGKTDAETVKALSS